ncbi:unnamed protein product [Echinostoma caproni]|uniref:Protein kinase domain-containing protein n=1 Tax=Echinostoma caproni TaxID=27848 RepID=A0A183A8D3_9TREM|nr:unnamed protein product [Echinostoma caproni]
MGRLRLRPNPYLRIGIHCVLSAVDMKMANLTFILSVNSVCLSFGSDYEVLYVGVISRFVISGYAGILPTLIRVYNQQVNNAVLTHAVEFTCRQFYVMHRTPFILQLFGSLANYVLIGDESTAMSDDFYRIQPGTLYRLLRSINRPSVDNLKILELCDVQKPLRALDFCYEDDDANWSVLDAINLCVTVIVYAPDSYRARQMLVILQAILPFILRDLPVICAEENCGAEPKKAELLAIQKVSTAMRQLISTTEFMTRDTEIPTGTREVRDAAKRGVVGGTLIQMDPVAGESRAGANVTTSVSDQPSGPLAASRWNYEPREIILQLACDFLSCCSARLAEMGERQRIPELLDPKSHVRLSELAQSFIKQVPTNPDLLSGTALQRYFLEILPLVEWGHESMRSCKALESLLGRINRTLPKLLENASLRVLIETLKKAVIFDPSGCLPALARPKPEVHVSHSAWSGISNAVPGRPSLGEALFSTISPENSSIGAPVPGRTSGKGRSPNNGEVTAHGCPSTTTGVLVNKHGVMDNADLMEHGGTTYSFKFAAEVIRLIALVLQVMGSNFCLKDLCERSGPDYNNRCPALLEGGFPTLATYLGQLIIPLLFRCCAGRKDSPSLSKENVFYALDVCVTALFAPETSSKSSLRTQPGQPQYLEPRSSISPERVRDKTNRYVPESSTVLSPPTIVAASSAVTVTNIATGLMDLSSGTNALRLMNLSSLGPDQETGPFSTLPRLICPTLSGITSIDSAESINQQKQQPQQQQQAQQSSQTPGSQQQQQLQQQQQSQRHSTQPSSQPQQQQQQPQQLLQPNSQSTRSGGKTEGVLGSGAVSIRARASVIATGTKPSLALSKSKPQSTHTRLLDTSAISAISLGERPTNFKAEFAHRLGFLGLKLILVAYSRHASVRLRLLTATLTKLALNGRSGIQLWKFFDFLTTHRPPLFVHLLPFIRFKLAHLRCATPGEQAYQQIVSQKLIGLHLPVPQTTAAVLRELMMELGTIQHDVQHFTQAQFKELQPGRSTRDSVRRLYSSDHSPAARKRSSRRAKTKLSGLTEESAKPESDMSLPDHTNLRHRVDVLASVTSESACSSEHLFDDTGFGLPSLSRASRGVRTMNQSFRQSILIRDPRKRIGAHDGSRLLTQNQTLKQSDPILTASAESIHRQSQNVSRRKIRQTSTVPSDNAPPTLPKSHLAKASFLLSDTTFDDQSLGSFTSDELRGPVGPAAAAAIATSLYGSGAPYIHARDKARQELALLVGIAPPELETSTDRRDSSILDLSLSDQSVINMNVPKLDTLTAGTTTAGHEPGRSGTSAEKMKTPRASKIDYV